MKTTIEDVLIDVIMNGCDRAALVRDEGGPGVLVLLASTAAASRIGPGLIEIMREMGDSGKREIGRIDCHTPVSEIFALTDGAANGWTWFEMPFGKLKVIASAFVGMPWCERVAAHCTANGAPCSLDRNRPAKGHEIERTIVR